MYVIRTKLLIQFLQASEREESVNEETSSASASKIEGELFSRI
jgi:hypothetical protein